MKANSSRVKGKNFRDFNGKPLFRWVLDTLLQVEEISKVVINTDARDILEQHGCVDTSRILIRDRKTEICGDDVSMNRIISDDIANIPAHLYLMTHTTNPLLRPHTITQALNTFYDARDSSQADSLFTVNKVQSRFYTSDVQPVNHDPTNLIPTQELVPWYEENSNLYLFTAQSFASTQARIGQNPVMHVSPYLESVDIDTPSDWDFCLTAARYLDTQQ